MNEVNMSRLPSRWTAPLGVETLLAVTTAYFLYELSGHSYCDQVTQNSRIWFACGVLLSLPLTWLTTSHDGRTARSTTWLLITLRLALAAFVFLFLQPYSTAWYMEC